MTDHTSVQVKIIKVYSLEETKHIAQQWLDIFGKNRRGAHTKAYKWHVFSYGRYPALEGEPALEEYAQQVPCACIVLPNEKGYSAVLAEDKPYGCHWTDYYVFPVNMAWVMAFTHEDGWLGPYFAKHPDYVKLNAENKAKARKAEEKAEAIRRGWAAPADLGKEE